MKYNEYFGERMSGHLERFLGIHYIVFTDLFTGFEAFYDSSAFLPLDYSLWRIWGLLGF